MNHGGDIRTEIAKTSVLYNIGPDAAVHTRWTLSLDEIRQDAEVLYCPQITRLLFPLPFDCEHFISTVQVFIIGVWSKNSNASKFVDSTADDYIQCVQEAVENETHFSIFRRDPRYVAVVETVSPVVAHAYSQIILENSPFLFESVNILNHVVEDQLYGSPVVVEVATYFGVTTVACLKFRYLKHISDFIVLLDLFSELNSDSLVGPFRVAEIGVGFGGLAQTMFAVVSDLSPRPAPLSYMFFDLPEVLLLTKKYIQKFAWIESQNTKYMNNYLDTPTTSGAVLSNFNLCISNYALSELSKDLQDEYIEKVLQFCSMGYLLYNSLGIMFGRTAVEISELLATRLGGLTVKIKTEEVYNYKVQHGELIVMNVDTFDSLAINNKLIVWKV